MLDARHPRWAVSAEQTQMVAGNAALQLDMVVTPTEPGLLSVVIENEYEPALTVSQEAQNRLGLTIKGRTTPVARSVELVTPAALQHVPQGAPLDTALASERGFRWALWRTDSATNPGQLERWPTSGHIEGSLDDLAGFVEMVMVDEAQLRQAVNTLQATVEEVAAQLHRTLSKKQRKRIGKALHQQPNLQTTQMAVTLVGNAFTFERAIEQLNLGVTSAAATKQQVRATWQTILAHNYWPIFHVARKVMKRVPSAIATATVIDPLVDLADQLVSYGVTKTGDMVGQLFGTLISDRKFLATFYTLPESAHLLAKLCVQRLNLNPPQPAGSTGDQPDPNVFRDLKIADFACGTGALLTATVHRVSSRARRSGIDDATLHQDFMERGVYALDVLPASVHLTATLLASMHPTVTFTDTRIALAPYGAQKQKGGGPTSYRLGSLELLDPTFHWADTATFTSNTPQVAAAGGTGETEAGSYFEPESFDLVIMNPPFSSPTNSEQMKAGQPIPAFAGLGTSEDTQQAMSNRLTALTNKRRSALRQDGIKPAGSGKSGLASNFLDVADRMLITGGILGLVTPLTALAGDGWRNFRDLLMRRYHDLTVVSIASTGKTGRAFSADTAMSEVLIVGTRNTSLTPPKPVVRYINLHERPASPLAGVQVATSIAGTSSSGHGTLTVGGDTIGTWMTHPALEGGPAALDELGVAHFADAMRSGTLAFPVPQQVPLCRLDRHASVGPTHRKVGNLADSKKPSKIGPFTVRFFPNRNTPPPKLYPVLWAHKHQQERHLVVTPDSWGDPKNSASSDAGTCFASNAAVYHSNQEFQFTSQALAACFTPEPSLGGRAWPTVKFNRTAWQYAALLWANSTLGLIDFWWQSTRQHLGRGEVTLTRIGGLLTIDHTSLTPVQHLRAKHLFDRFKTLSLLPANEAYRDDVRQQLDRAVLVELLGLNWATIAGPLDTLRLQWCAEPSVHGDKSTKP